MRRTACWNPCSNRRRPPPTISAARTLTRTRPEPVRLAILLMAAHFYEYRDSSDKAAYATMLSAFHALLYPHRVIEEMF